MTGSNRDAPDDDDDPTRIASRPPDSQPASPASSPDASSDPPSGAADEATRIVTGDDSSAAPTRIVSPASGAEDGNATVISPGPGEPDPGGKLPIGTLINNNYRIDAVLKSGGMGEVYRGTEIHTDNPVAIKAILRERADDAEAGLMFKREASTLSQLRDETIVGYLNFVPDAALQRYFLVMEFIEGVPLKDYIAEHGALPVEKVRTLLIRLAKGLSAAHEREVIHRDLSPDNVMLDGGRVEDARLIDFGIAKSTVVTDATIEGRFAGKFRYVAPEQLGDYGGTVTPKTDIYGLGLLIAAAAIGKPLEMGASIVQAVQSRKSIPDLSAVPQELRPILAHMLEPDPAHRPASMAEVKAMAEDPARIPPAYLGDWVPPPAGSAPAASFGSMTSTPPAGSGVVTATGLQVPGLTQPSGTGPLGGPARPGAHTGSLGATTGLGTGVGAPPGTVPGGSLPPGPRPSSGGGATGLVLGLLLLAALGGGGYLAWSTGLVEGLGGGGPAQEAATTATTPPGIPAPRPETREGFLATLDTGECTHVSRVDQGPNTGVIEGFSATGERFAGLPVAYEEAFGARPEVLPRVITPQQCAALDFVRALQGRGRNGVDMVLSDDVVASQAPVTAQLTVPSTQAVWVVLIDPRGRVFNLTPQLSEPVGNSRSMTFALALGPGIERASQLLLAVESDTPPLSSTALVRDRDGVGSVLPRVLEEIAERGGAASATLSYLELVAQAPDEGAAQDSGGAAGGE